MMTHTFHIPVLGLAFSVDTPLKVAQYGISSVMSIVDDELVERLRAYYSKQHNLPYQEIEKYSPDARANRISAYLNMVKYLVDQQIRHIKRANWLKDEHAIQYFRLLPEGELKQLFNNWIVPMRSKIS